MAMLAAVPTAHVGFAKEYTWDSARIQPYVQHNQGSSAVSLPSIRHQFPDLLSTAGEASPPSRTYHYSPNPGKRRRTSTDDELERQRARQIPRLLPHGEHQSHRSSSPQRALSVAPPAPVEVSERGLHVESGPAVPRFHATMSTERPVAGRPVLRDSRLDDYRDAASHQAPAQAQQPMPPAPIETTHRHARASYDFGYQGPHRVNATSPPQQSNERSPFSAGTYPRHSYPEYPRYGETSQVGGHHDQKQRKRRGNLPKETTDKLRSWFHAHVSHPYPTEDEKQELMRQTGLQMNQISNWFINARRRQLPAMITNARVTSDAMNGRGADGKILPSRERTLTLSDGEGAAYDEELDSYQRYQASNSKRTSV